MTKIFIMLGLSQDPAQTMQSYAEGLAPDRIAYGFHLAEAEGFDVTYSQDMDGRRPSRLRRIGLRLFDADIVQAFRNRRRIRNADAVWAMSERESLGVAFMMRLGIVPKRPIISSSVWVWSNWERTGVVRRWLYHVLLKPVSVMTVQSERCLPIARYAAPMLKTELMYFGINDETFAPLDDVAVADGAIRILAAGNDKTRDWATLLAAFGGDGRYQVRFICPWLSRESIAAYPNVELANGNTIAAFREHYRWADVVAVPMMENAFSGITVALEAAALGRAILSSDTGGVPTYFNRDEAIYVPVGDAQAMRRALGGLTRTDINAYAARAHRKFLEADYTTRHMISDYASLTRTALDKAKAVGLAGGHSRPR